MTTAAFRLTAPPMTLGDLRILGMSLHEPMPRGLVHRPHGLDGYLLAFFPAKTTIDLQGNEQSAPPQSLVIWEPEAAQRFGNAEQAWEYSWLSCDSPSFQTTLDTLAIARQTIIPLPDPTRIDRFLQELHRECTRYLRPNATIVQNIVHNWLLEVQRHLMAPETSQPLPPWASTILQYLEMHFADSITLAQLADLVHFSEDHCDRKFKQVFGMPPIEYLTQIRMRMATFLLLDNNLSITDIAQRTGYDNYSYFSRVFKRHHGISPREMRQGLSGEAERRQHAEERRSRELARWLREGWQVALDVDFTAISHLPPSVHDFWAETGRPLTTAPHMAEVTNGLLRLAPNQGWTGITWDGELKEDLKVAIVAVNATADGLNLAIAISGDLWNGYRLRLVGYQDIALETSINGCWEVLHRCAIALDPHAEEYHLVFWRSDNVFYAEVDGRRILAYHEPFAPQGAAHRRFAIARFHDYGSADLRMLRVCTRITPRYVDILEPGRAMLREGHRRSAFSWFRRVAEEHPEATLQQEAGYLAALALPDTEREAKETAFHQATADTANPFHRRLLRQWAFTRLGWGDIAGAVDMALRCVQDLPDDETPQILAERLITTMHGMSPTLLEQALISIARLPLTSLNLKSLPLASFAPLRGMALRVLTSYSSHIDDLSPLQGMPLEQLVLHHSHVNDLTPLAHTPLRDLACLYSDLRELTPLRGMSLCSLKLWHECYRGSLSAHRDAARNPELQRQPHSRSLAIARDAAPDLQLHGECHRRIGAIARHALTHAAVLTEYDPGAHPIARYVVTAPFLLVEQRYRFIPLARPAATGSFLRVKPYYRSFSVARVVADRAGLPRECHCRPVSSGRAAVALSRLWE